MHRNNLWIDGDMVNVDPMSVSTGYVIFTLQTSDDENDELDYSCSVANSLNPLQCLSGIHSCLLLSLVYQQFS